MQLNPEHTDALCELVNIGFGRAASALSILVGQRVLIEAPTISLYSLRELDQALKVLSIGEITSVHQVFSGQIAGTAMLLMDSGSSMALVDLMTGELIPEDRPPQETDRETMQEIGNILLNAFTGSFGNLLQVRISFTVPQVHYSSLKRMIDSLMIDQHELEYALVVRVNFTLLGGNVSGYVVIVMGIQSMSEMMKAMQAAGYID